jgi:hypothetical protein
MLVFSGKYFALLVLWGKSLMPANRFPFCNQQWHAVLNVC